MKIKLSLLLLTVILLLTWQQPTYALDTVFFGKSINGNGTGLDYMSTNPDNKYSGSLDTYLVDFVNISEIKKIKIEGTYETGNYNYLPQNPTIVNTNLQVGIPIVIRDKGLVYITAGYQTYDEYANANPQHESYGPVLGLDVICTPAEPFQVEFNLQHSIGGYCNLYYDNSSGGKSVDHSDLDLTILVIKAQYILSQNLGVALYYHLADYNSPKLGLDVVDLSSTTLGLVYRF
jgi:hypothetical protein